MLKEGRLGGVEAQAYVVLGDVFRLRGRNEEALLAYLRVHLMCDDVDAVTHARALVGAVKAFRKLGRREQSRQLREALTRRFPGALWERKLRE